MTILFLKVKPKKTDNKMLCLLYKKNPEENDCQFLDYPPYRYYGACRLFGLFPEKCEMNEEEKLITLTSHFQLEDNEEIRIINMNCNKKYCNNCKFSDLNKQGLNTCNLFNRHLKTFYLDDKDKEGELIRCSECIEAEQWIDKEDIKHD